MKDNAKKLHIRCPHQGSQPGHPLFPQHDPMVSVLQGDQFASK